MTFQKWWNDETCLATDIALVIQIVQAIKYQFHYIFYKILLFTDIVNICLVILGGYEYITQKIRL